MSSADEFDSSGDLDDEVEEDDPHAEFSDACARNIIREEYLTMTGHELEGEIGFMGSDADEDEEH
jgi:hypothetical protein